MPANHRRTRFATPLVITVAASCGGSKEPPKPEPTFPGTTWDVRMAAVGCRAIENVPLCPAHANCPAPREAAAECPPGTSGRTVIRVAELPDKTCGILPANCFDASCVKLKAPCPLPPGQVLPVKLVEIWTVEKRAAGCHAEEEEHDCPPNVDCNPPQPRMIPCPEGITETINVKVAPLRDGTCAIVPEGCIEERCATVKTPCPPK